MESNSKKRILAWSDTALAGTGFGVVSRHILSALHATGDYDIHHLAINFHGEFVNEAEIPWQQQPARLLDPNDPHGLKMFARTLSKTDYDIVWVCNDLYVTHQVADIIPQVRDLYLKRGKKPPVFIYYYPVDCHVLSDACNFLKYVDIPVCYTDHGRIETLKVLPEIEKRLKQISHGVNTEVYRPLSSHQIASLKLDALGVTEDTTVIINFNRNSARKQMQYSLLAFHEFRKYVPRSIMYMHTVMKDQGGDLIRAVHELGFDTVHDVIFPVKYNPGNPAPLEVMNQLYNTGDIFLTTHLGEGYGLCLDSSTILDTYRGGIKIKDVLIGDEVVGQDGKFHKVLNKTSRIVDEIYSVKSMYSSEILVTSEHPFFIQRKDGGSPTWINVKDINLGDYLAIPKLTENQSLPLSIDILDYLEDNIETDGEFVWYKMGYSPKKEGLSISDIQKKFNISKRVAEDARRCYLGTSLPSRGLSNSLAYSIAQKIKEEELEINQKQLKIKRYISITDEFLYFIGWYLSEGSNGLRNKIEIDLNIKELCFAKKISNYLNETFNVDSIVEQNGSNKCRVRLSGTVLAKVMGNICGEKARNKRIPSFLLKSPRQLGPLMKSLFLGDGYFDYQPRSHTLSTISPSLAYQIRYICSANNILTTTTNYPPRNIGKYDYFICRIVTPHMDRWMKFTNQNISIREINRKSAVHFIENEQYFFIKINKISKKIDTRTVYDICVEDTHSFVANGILVHNTQIEAMAAGVPVVAPDNTSVPEILGHNGERGYIYPCKDLVWIDDSGFRPKGLIPDIVDMMMTAYKDGPKYNNPITHKAREWAVAHDWKEITKEWAQLFAEAQPIDPNSIGPSKVGEEI